MRRRPWCLGQRPPGNFGDNHWPDQRRSPRSASWSWWDSLGNHTLKICKWDGHDTMDHGKSWRWKSTENYRLVPVTKYAQLVLSELHHCGHWKKIRGPFHLRFFARNSNSMETSPCCNSVAGHQIATKFCTCHDSTAVVPCTKFCSDHCIRIEMTVKRNFHRIWIVMETRLVYQSHTSFNHQLWVWLKHYKFYVLNFAEGT